MVPARDISNFFITYSRDIEFSTQTLGNTFRLLQVGYNTQENDQNLYKTKQKQLKEVVLLVGTKSLQWNKHFVYI